MMRLDHNRTLSQLGAKRQAGHQPAKAIVWGNHSATQYPDVSRCEADGKKVGR